MPLAPAGGGVSLEDRQDLLEHEACWATTHHRSAEVADLMKAASAVKRVPRISNAHSVPLAERGGLSVWSGPHLNRT